MRSLPIHRKRIPSEPVLGGVVPNGYGTYDDSIPLGAQTGLYHFHEGDIFFPGAPSFVYESPFERTPIFTLWGAGGILVQAQHMVMPYEGAPTVYYPNVVQNGIGGLQAGDMMMQPLLEPGGQPGLVNSQV